MLFDATQVLGALGGRLENENQALFGGWAGGPWVQAAGEFARTVYCEHPGEPRILSRSLPTRTVGSLEASALRFSTSHDDDGLKPVYHTGCLDLGNANFFSLEAKVSGGK